MEIQSLKKRISDNAAVTKEIISENPPFPKTKFLLEVSNACNDTCIFCYNRFMSRKLGNINEEIAKKALTEAHELGMREVGFYATGEPLLNPRLEEYIRYATDIGYSYTYITTNGALANLDRFKSLVNSGLKSIKFSINALTDSDYRKIHGTNDFELVIKNLKDIYEYKIQNQLNINVFVSVIKTRYTEYEDKQIREKFEKITDEIVILDARNQGGWMPCVTELLTPCKTSCSQMTFCNMPFNSITISKEGFVTACCTDFQNALAYADLNKTSLIEAWNNRKIVELRKKHLSGELDGCLCNRCMNNKLTPYEPISDELYVKEDVTDALVYAEVQKRIVR